MWTRADQSVINNTTVYLEWVLLLKGIDGLLNERVKDLSNLWRQMRRILLMNLKKRLEKDRTVVTDRGLSCERINCIHDILLVIVGNRGRYLANCDKIRCMLFYGHHVHRRNRARIFVVLMKVASLISVRSCFSISGSTLGKNHSNSMPGCRWRTWSGRERAVRLVRRSWHSACTATSWRRRARGWRYCTRSGSPSWLSSWGRWPWPGSARRVSVWSSSRQAFQWDRATVARPAGCS